MGDQGEGWHSSPGKRQQELEASSMAREALYGANNQMITNNEKSCEINDQEQEVLIPEKRKRISLAFFIYDSLNSWSTRAAIDTWKLRSCIFTINLFCLLSLGGFGLRAQSSWGLRVFITVSGRRGRKGLGKKGRGRLLSLWLKRSYGRAWQ